MKLGTRHYLYCYHAWQSPGQRLNPSNLGPRLQITNKKLEVELTVLKIWYQFVDNILHCPVETDVLQRMWLVDHNLTWWTCVVLFQVFHKATFTNCNINYKAVINAAETIISLVKFNSNSLQFKQNCHCLEIQIRILSLVILISKGLVNLIIRL